MQQCPRHRRTDARRDSARVVATGADVSGLYHLPGLDRLGRRADGTVAASVLSPGDWAPLTPATSFIGSQTLRTAIVGAR